VAGRKRWTYYLTRWSRLPRARFVLHNLPKSPEGSSVKLLQFAIYGARSLARWQLKPLVRLILGGRSGDRHEHGAFLLIFHRNYSLPD
jgi:hypothetical protein